MNYYNDIDKKVCAWTEELIKDGLIPDGKVDCRSIEGEVDLTGWPTPTAKEKAGGEYKDPEKALKRVLAPHASDLRDVARMAGWPTPQATQAPNMGENRGKDHGGSRKRETAQSVEGILGPEQPGTPAETEKPVAYRLNAGFSLWLILGTSAALAWLSCGERVTRSRQSAPRHS